jgi:GalNAc5-diNAcBac-PP-undecaprenol beta-1,3-glucosyltransferase
MPAPPLVTVILPTFDHVETLRYSIPTALAQTHSELELLVVGDGSPDRTREIVAEFAAIDERVHYHHFAKGPRNGEAHRHRLLLDHARGDWVFYLGDDDLWLPDHVERLLGWMLDTGANFGCCQPCWIMPDGAPALRWVVDLSHPWYRTELLEGRNRVPLNCGAHSMQLYEALPHGWRTTPAGTPTDLYMWQQLLEHPDCVATSAPWTSVIGVPASQRTGANVEARVAELAAWSPTTDGSVRERFYLATQDGDRGLLAHARYEAEYTIALGVVDGLHAHQVNLTEELAAVREQLFSVAAERDQLAAQLHTVYESRGWRALERLRRLAGRR